MNKIRILLADDHELIRDGVRARISAQPDLEVVGEAGDGRQAIQLAQQLRPDVVVMDISMPKLNGLKATKMLKDLCPEIKILTLTRHTDSGYLRQLLEAGASGYVLKQSSSDELLRAIRAVAADQSFLDAAVTEGVIDNAIGRSGVRGAAERSLSAREEEVLRLIAWGFSNKEIAARMNISVKTVEVHKANGTRKMGMSGRIDIVRYAILKGWLEDQ